MIYNTSLYKETNTHETTNTILYLHYLSYYYIVITSINIPYIVTRLLRRRHGRTKMFTAFVLWYHEAFCDKDATDMNYATILH